MFEGEPDDEEGRSAREEEVRRISTALLRHARDYPDQFLRDSLVEYAERHGYRTRAHESDGGHPEADLYLVPSESSLEPYRALFGHVRLVGPDQESGGIRFRRSERYTSRDLRPESGYQERLDRMAMDAARSEVLDRDGRPSLTKAVAYRDALEVELRRLDNVYAPLLDLVREVTAVVAAECERSQGWDQSLDQVFGDGGQIPWALFPHSDEWPTEKDLDSIRAHDAPSLYIAAGRLYELVTQPWWSRDVARNALDPDGTYADLRERASGLAREKLPLVVRALCRAHGVPPIVAEGQGRALGRLAEMTTGLWCDAERVEDLRSASESVVRTLLRGGDIPGANEYASEVKRKRDRHLDARERLVIQAEKDQSAFAQLVVNLYQESLTKLSWNAAYKVVEAQVGCSPFTGGPKSFYNSPKRATALANWYKQHEGSG